MGKRSLGRAWLGQEEGYISGARPRSRTSCGDEEEEGDRSAARACRPFGVEAA
ncbi:hypothetical protein HBI14_111180 [Parastagonospora nodorum]|nr:hypothetical protein HBI14_111180 [Parastagonospora nodorum]